MKKALLSLSLATLALAGTVQAQSFTQTFEGVTVPAIPTGWTNTPTGGGAGWVTNSGSHNWPLASIPAHTKYCFVDDYNVYHNNPAYMTTPVFSLVGVTSPYLSYDYFYLKAHLTTSGVAEQAWIEISTTSGASWSLLDSIPAITTGAWASKYISLASYSASTTCELRFCYTDNGGSSTGGIIGVAIDNVSVFGAVSNDIAITDLSPKATAINDYYLPSATATFTGTVLNHGLTAISSFVLNYQAGASPVVSSTITAAIPSFTTYAFTAPTPLTVPSGNTPVKVWVTLAGDANHNNDSAATAVVGVPSFPPKKIFFEEATGSWCGYCVRGIVYMDSLYKLHGDNVSIASVHNYNGYDAMAIENASTTGYDHLISSMVGGFPSMVIDRAGTSDPDACLDDYNTLNGNVFGFATIAMTPNFSGSTVGATVSVNPVIAMSGDYRLEMIITEDKVHGTSAGYAQHNYYSSTNPGGSAGALAGCGYNFTDSLPVIPAKSMYFPFVDRLTVPADVSTTNGVAGSLPATMAAGTNYTYTFSPVTLTSTWDKNNVRVIVILVDNNPSSLTFGMVLNSANSGKTFNEIAAGVKSVTVGDVEDIRVFPNPASDMAHVMFSLKETSKVQFSVFDMSGREVFNHAAEQMNAGGNQINISTTDFSSGVYNVVITTDNGTVTERLSVTK